MTAQLFALFLALCTPNKSLCIYETTPAAFVSQAVCTDAALLLRGIREREFGVPLIIDEIDCFVERGA